MTPNAPPKSAPPTPPAAAPQAKSSGSAKSPALTGDLFTRMTPSFEPERIVINAVEGWGKTTIGAYAPKPLILMAKGDSGYKTLLSVNRAPSIDGKSIMEWDELLGIIEYLIQNDTGHETLVLDALGGFESLCHSLVCDRDYKGKFNDKGFMSYNKGYDTSVNDWKGMLHRLDRLRDARKMRIIMLSHCTIKPFNNPLGENFDRYVADCHQKTWSPTHKWADAVLFGNFYTIVDKEGGAKTKGKGIGGDLRVLYTRRRDAYDAKNRYGMVEEIEMSEVPSEGWATLEAAIRGSGTE